MITFLQAVILGIIQGITEWLPISSSGHLALAQMYFGLSVPVAFDVMLHVATLAVVFIVFWKDIVNILKAVLSLDFKSENGKLALYIIIANIPTAIIGFAFRDTFKSFFYNRYAIASALIFTSIFLYFSDRKTGNKKLNYKNTFLIGIAQGIAIIPGISRSGITISMGLLGKIDRKLVAKFSFLLSIPAIIGASIFEVKNLALADISIPLLSVAMISSFIVGYISLKLLLKIIINKKFHLFAYYCFILGLILFVI
ncbi:MAG: undecaprenyl-diphosphate phosphatase [Nanoarchaeota archaeon]|nr:undecaprenyl-diphosphate phosphatase [Nanoarchaeota archaeon]MCG2719018.1 undecaprenyl-diphosphate phosphatase [Nanoarchaeota archaeon]